MDAPDAGEILNHLNLLGYRNISSAQLKEFQKDLRKLIKFDTTDYVQDKYEQSEEQKNYPAAENVFERLHAEQTVSYRAKHTPCAKQNQYTQSTMNKENNTPAPASNTRTECKMWIRPKSSLSLRRSDPVALYHSYQKDWNKFKQKLPGENDHSELRWKIRNKLLGE